VIKYIQVALHQVESVAFISLTQLRTIGARSIQKKNQRLSFFKKIYFLHLFQSTKNTTLHLNIK